MIKNNILKVYSGIAILFVVIIHANAFYLQNILNLKYYSEGPIILEIFDTIIQIAVPMFIFISGYKYEMTNYKRNLSVYYRKKINNIFKPFIIITLTFIIPILILSILKKLILNTHIDLWYYLNILVNRTFKALIGYNEVYQLWYIPMYLLIVFTYPVIEKYIKKEHRLIVFIIIALLQRIIALKFTVLSLHPIDFIYYYILFELGVKFYRDDKLLDSIKILNILYITSILVSVLISETYISVFFKEFILYPIGVVVFYNISTKLKNNKVLLFLGEYSFYIFLFHEPIFMGAISRLLKGYGIYNSCIWIPIMSILGISLSTIFYFILSKLKIGRYILNIDNINQNKVVDNN